MTTRLFRRELWSLSILLAALAVTHAAEEKPAAAPAAKVTYDDHVRPILREHCFTCHNQNQTKGGLALDAYRAVMTGGSSGEVVFAEDLASSRLWLMVNHEDQPYMPPAADKLAAAKLDVIKAWIEGGALENAGSKAAAKKTSSLALSATPSGQRPANPAMPERLWRQPVVHSAHAGAITALAASPWAPLVAVAGQRQIVLYHADTYQLLGILPFLEGTPYVLRFSRDGSVLLAAGGRGGQSGCVVLYDVKTGRRITKLGEELDAVLAADISDNLTRVALGGPQRLVRIYSTETGGKLHEIKKHTDWIYTVQFSPDGVLLATGDRSNGLFVWEAETAREYLDLRGHTGAVTDVSWRSDSNVLASASMDGSVRLWEMNEGKTIRSFSAHGGGAMAVSYALDGRLATAGRDNTAKAWTADGNALKAFPPFGEMALKTAFLYDGKRIVAGDWLGELRVWQIDDAKQVATLSPNPPPLDGADKAAFDQVPAQLTAAADQAQQQAAAAQAKVKQLETERAALETAVKDRAAAVKALSEKLPGAQADYDKAVADQKDAAAKLAAKVQELQQAHPAADAAQTLATETAAARQAFKDTYNR